MPVVPVDEAVKLRGENVESMAMVMVSVVTVSATATFFSTVMIWLRPGTNEKTANKATSDANSNPLCCMANLEGSVCFI